MPRFEITAPDGRKFEITAPEGASQSEVLAYAQANYQSIPQGPKESTIGSELIRGGKQVLSSARTGLESIFSPEEAARAGVARSEAIGQEAGTGPSLEAVQKAYQDKGVLSAAGEAVSQIPRALAGQGANLASMYAAGRAGSAAGAPFGVRGRAIGAGVGAAGALLPQFMGSNVERQASEQMDEGKDVSIDRTKAYTAAAGQAALEGVGTALTLGKRVVKGVLGIVDDAALATTRSQTELVKAAERSLAASAGRGVARGAAEIPVEVSQQILERYQAGLDLTSPEALKEYGESAYQAALIGTPIGGVSGVAERGQARSQVEQQKRAEEAARPAPPAPEPEPEIVPGAKLREDAPAGTQGKLFTRKEMGSKIPEPKAVPEPPVAAVQQGEQLGLGLDFQRDYNDLATEREALRAGPRTAEARTRIAELTEQMASYDEATAGQRQAEELIKAERDAKKAKAAVAPVAAEPVVTGITQADIDAIGLPLRTSKQWVQDNVIGKTVEELQALVQREPNLINNKGARAEVLKALIAPQPTAFEEKPNVQTTTKTDQSQGELDLGGGKPSVGVSGKPASTNVVQPGTGISTTTGTSATPDGLGLAPAGQPVSTGTQAQGTPSPAVVTPTERTSNQVQDEIRTLQNEQQSLLTKAGRVPAVKSPARAKWDAFTDQIAQKKTEWDALDQAERKAKNAPTTTTTAPPSTTATTTTAKGPKTTAKPAATTTPPKETKAPAPAVATETVDEEAARKAEAEEIKRRLDEVERKQKEAQAKADADRNIPAPKVTPTKKPVVETAPAPEIEPEVVSPFAIITKYKNVKAQAETAVKNKPKAEISYAERTTLSEATLQDHIAQGKTREALQSILSAPNGLYNELDRAVARRMLLSGSLPTVQIVPEGSLGKADDGKVVAGQYDAETDDIKLADGYVGALTFLHELVHGFTHRAIVSHTSGETNNAGVRALQELYNHVKKVNPGAIKEYGMTDLSEFAAEAMANQKFQAILHKIPYRRTNAFTEFARRVLQVLGLAPTDTHTSLAAAMISVDNIMTSGRQKQVAETGTSVAGTQNTPKVQFSTSYTPQDVVNSLGPLTPLDERSVKQMVFGMQKEGDPTAGVKFRVAVADSAAAIEEKFSRTFNGAVRNALGKINPMGLYRQAQDYSKILAEYFQNGTLVKDKTTGLYRTVGKGEGAPIDVFPLIYAWGAKTGRTNKEAEQFASRVLEAKRLDEVLKVNPDFPKHLSDRDRAVLVAEYNSDPVFAQMSAAMDKPRLALIDKMVEVGRLSQETANEWKSVVGYVPFDRIEDFTDKFSTVKKTTGRSPLALTKDPELVGSFKRPVGNVFENYLNTMGWMVGQVMNNDARVQTLTGLQELGFTKAPARMPGTENRSAKAYVNGELRYWELPSRYDVAAFQDLNPPKMAIMRTLGTFSNILRKSVTLLPPFALKQVTDDVQRAMLTSGVKSPTALLRMTLANFGSLAWAELRGIQHPIVKEFGALGLTGEYDFQAGKPALSVLKDLGYRERTVAGSKLLGTLLHRLDGITRASDLAVRKAIYEQTMIENNKDHLLAQSRAREFINFRRRGASEAIAIATATIPFFNAYVQGMDVLYRAASGKDSSSSVGRAQARQLFWSRAGTVAMLSTMYALMSGDDEDYQDMDLRTRNSNWILPGGYKIPVPGELGALFKVIPETVIEYLRRSGTPEEQTALEAIRSAAKYMSEQYIERTVPIPQAVKPLIEAWTNYSFFTGRELEGIYQKQQDPSMRVTSKTSELAQAISNFSRDVIGVDAVSPIQIDNMLSGYLGSTAALVTMMTDSLINPSRIDRPLHKYAFLSNYMYDPVGTRRLTEFYDEREKVGKANNTLRQLIITDIARAEAYAESHQTELALESSINSTLEQLERTRAYRKHLNSPDGAAEMSKTERESELEEIKRMEVEYTRWVREAKTALRKEQR